MTRIEKKVKQKYFEVIQDGRKQFEVRLADFECNNGDIVILQEQDENTNELTGRTIDCEVLYKLNTKEVEKFYSKEDIDKYGLLILGIRKHYDFKK
jgi:hypothetical protein